MLDLDVVLEDCEDIDWLKKNHQMIHYFGLGFIQLKIDDRFRMHFYTQELPAIISDEDVHNHRYNFESRILRGEFRQSLYHVVDGNSHVLEQESCQEGYKPETPGKPCSIIEASAHIYEAGSLYFMHHSTFHRVSATSCITLLERYSYEKPLAEVIRPVGAEKVCPFSKKVDESELWDIAERMLQNIG